MAAVPRQAFSRRNEDGNPGAVLGSIGRGPSLIPMGVKRCVSGLEWLQPGGPEIVPVDGGRAKVRGEGKEEVITSVLAPQVLRSAHIRQRHFSSAGAVQFEQPEPTLHVDQV